MADGAPPTLPPEVQERIPALRRQRRQLRVVGAVFRVGCLLSAFCWLAFGLDWTLELPVAIRAINLVAAICILAVGIRTYSRFAGQPESDAWLATRIEAATGDLSASIITAVELANPQNPRSQLYSPRLIQRTVEEAEAQLLSVGDASLVAKRGTIAAFGIFAMMFTPLALAAALRKDLAQTFLERDVLLRSTPWPRENFLVIEEPTDPVTLIAMGDPLTVLVQRVRGTEARAAMEVEFAGESGRQIFALEQKGADRFRKVFRNVTRDFGFRVVSGDFRSEIYEIRVRHRPRIEDIAVTFDYPDYTGLDAAAAASGAEATAAVASSYGGHIKVPFGTIVKYTARASIPVATALYFLEYQEGGETQSRSHEVAIVDGTKLSGEFTADRDGHYYFRLVSKDGFENPSPIRFRVAVVPDAAPNLEITRPAKNLEVSLRAIFPITVKAQDDYGLSSARLAFRALQGDGPLEGDLLSTDIALSELAGLKSGEVDATCDLEQLVVALKTSVGSRIEYTAEGRDALNQLGVARNFVLTLVADQDLTRILQDELTLIRESLEQSIAMQRESHREGFELLEHARINGGKVPMEDLPALRQARIQEERIELRLRESVARLGELIQRVSDNRLTWQDLPWIQTVEERLSRIVAEQMPPVLADLAQILRLAGDQQALASHLEHNLDLQQSVIRALADLLMELQEWGDLRSLVRKLEELRNSQNELEQQVEQKIQEKQRP
ncbi:MAG: hypothetical protein ACKVX7_14710 [Planctomycetota bacterium]